MFSFSVEGSAVVFSVFLFFFFDLIFDVVDDGGVAVDGNDTEIDACAVDGLIVYVGFMLDVCFDSRLTF